MGLIYYKKKPPQAALRALSSLRYSAARYLMVLPLVMFCEVMRDIKIKRVARELAFCSLAYSAARYLRENPGKGEVATGVSAARGAVMIEEEGRVSFSFFLIP